jgi:hypothetical protein
MDDINVPVFAQAKLEYTKQLIDLMYSHFNDGITSIYDESKVIYSNRTGTPVLIIFRSLLEKVPLWNSEIIDSETDRIMRSSKCDCLDDLITAVFISHTRILMSIGPNQSFKKINVTIPKTTSFIHKTYINIAREIWKNPYLFNENVPGHEYQRNMKNVEDMIKLSIEDTIRRELPVKDILREHLDTYDNNDKVDIQMILNELKKSQNLNETLRQDVKDDVKDDEEEDTKEDDKEESEIFDEPNEPLESRGPLVKEDSHESSDDLPNVFQERVQLEEEEKQPEEMKYDNVDIVDEKVEMEEKYTNPYNDPNDPSIDDIKKNTHDIVLNDITMPVLDNTEVKEPQTNLGFFDDLIDTNKKDEDAANDVVDIVNDVKNVDEVTVVRRDENENVIDTPKPVKDEVKEDAKEDVKMFSFANLYPNMKGKGKVEEITKIDAEKEKTTLPSLDEDKVTEVSLELNEQVMKEVMTLDKNKEDVDETETLDNFFREIKELASKNDKSITINDTKEESYTFFD